MILLIDTGSFGSTAMAAGWAGHAGRQAGADSIMDPGKDVQILEFASESSLSPGTGERARERGDGVNPGRTAGPGDPRRVLLGAAQGLAELLFEEAVAVLQGGDLALEHVLGPGFVVVEPLQEGVEVFASGERLLGIAVGEDCAGLGVDHQVGATVGAADGQLAGLAHGPILAASATLRAMTELNRLPSRDEAWELLCQYTEKEGLRKHALAVEAAMRHYARL